MKCLLGASTAAGANRKWKNAQIYSSFKIYTSSFLDVVIYYLSALNEHQIKLD